MDEKVRKHIIQLLSQAGVPPDRVMRIVENQIAQLFREYTNAPEDMKDEIYATYEKRLLDTLREQSHSNHSSTMSY